MAALLSSQSTGSSVHSSLLIHTVGTGVQNLVVAAEDVEIAHDVAPVALAGGSVSKQLAHHRLAGTPDFAVVAAVVPAEPVEVGVSSVHGHVEAPGQ